MTIQVKTGEETIQTLLARHSVRSYVKDHVIPEEEWKELLQIAVQAPSAWNLQHWKFLVVTSPEDKEKLLPMAYNQKQIVESSLTVAILGDTQGNLNAETVYAEGAVPAEFRSRMIESINQAYARGGVQFGRDQAFLNASLAAMQLMIAAKARGYDTVPMSGFDPERLSSEFNIPERYVPVMLISIGLAADQAKPSVRIPVEELLLNPSNS